MSIGFNQNGVENDYHGDTIEDYNHVIKILGIPLFSSTKKHVVQTQSKGRNPNI